MMKTPSSPGNRHGAGPRRCGILKGVEKALRRTTSARLDTPLIGKGAFEVMEAL